MALKPGDQAPKKGIYWCTVCKLPAVFGQGDTLPVCRNKCGKGNWEFVRDLPEEGSDSTA